MIIQLHTHRLAKPLWKTLLGYTRCGVLSRAFLVGLLLQRMDARCAGAILDLAVIFTISTFVSFHNLP
jgi:hypothetical protein